MSKEEIAYKQSLAYQYVAALLSVQATSDSLLRTRWSLDSSSSIAKHHASYGEFACNTNGSVTPAQGDLEMAGYHWISHKSMTDTVSVAFLNHLHQSPFTPSPAVYTIQSHDDNCQFLWSN